MSIQNVGGASGNAPAYVTPGNGGAPAAAASVPDQVAQRPAAQAEAAKSPAPSSSDAEQLKAAIAEMQRAVASRNSNLQFSVDDESGKTIVRVIDSDSGEVIRQIPSEEVMAISRSLGKLQGMLLNQKA